MSLVRFLPAWFHAIADYAVGVLLVVAALVVGGTGLAVATGVTVGVVVLVVSMLTKYPLGVKKVLPFTLHSAGDYLAVALLVVAPFALGFNDTDMGLTALYIAVGVAVLAVSLITNYQYSDNVQAAPAVVETPIDYLRSTKTSTTKPSARRTAATKPTTKTKKTVAKTRRTRPLVADKSAR